MRVIREAQNALDGPYRILGGQKDAEEKKQKRGGSGFREGESRVVRKLLDLGLAIPQKSSSKKESDR